MKSILKQELPRLFEEIARQQTLYIPADDGAKQTRFLPYQEGMVLSDALNTVRSAKDLFFPQVENLLKFTVSGKRIEIIDDRDPIKPFVVFGVRACDCRSFDILDRVFLYTEPQDTFYAARREHGTVVTLSCSKPAETCFCTAFGIDPADPAGDITAWDWADRFYFRANTEKGEALLSSLSLEDCDGAPVEDAKAATREIVNRLPLKDLNFSFFQKERMLEIFNDPRWASLSESCLGCGTCTFVCPTCQCYDIREFQHGDSVQRFRCWDSCMYSDFTQMSAGQPRPTQKERFRQRFMHKLVYYPANNDGVYSCVGCGRCLQKCPIHMNIVKVAKTLGGEAK